MPHGTATGSNELYPDVPAIEGAYNPYAVMYRAKPGVEVAVDLFEHLAPQECVVQRRGHRLPRRPGHQERVIPPPDKEWYLDRDKLNTPPAFKASVPAPLEYDPFGEPKMISYVSANSIDSYASRLWATPWAPYNAAIPSFGRFTNYLGGQNRPGPYGASHQLPPGTSTPALDKPTAFKPRKRYYCDGRVVKDETGQLMGRVRGIPSEGAIEIYSPEGKPWLRLDKQAKTVRNLNPDRKLRDKTDPVAVFQGNRVLNGDQTLWADIEDAPVLYEFKTQLNVEGQHLINIYDGKELNQIAHVTRPSDKPYPGEMMIHPNVPSHLLLIALFLI